MAQLSVYAYEMFYVIPDSSFVTSSVLTDAIYTIFEHRSRLNFICSENEISRMCESLRISLIYLSFFF